MGFLKKLFFLAILAGIAWLVFFNGKNPVADSDFSEFEKLQAKYANENALYPSTFLKTIEFESKLLDLKKNATDAVFRQWIEIRLRELSVGKDFFEAQKSIMGIGFENRNCSSDNPLGMAVSSMESASKHSSEAINLLNSFEKKNVSISIQLNVSMHKQTLQNLIESANAGIEGLKKYC